MLRLRFPLQQDGSACERLFTGVPANASPGEPGATLQRCLVLPAGVPQVLVGAGDGALHLWQLGPSLQRRYSVLATEGWIFAGDVLGNVWMLRCP